ncbi:MAG: tRNA lysidine(34) synthetase TilS [Bacteroidota bacterium]|nr:tRNA lysidine(34) synthetase TilS [Bacteroidota bacterium]
MARQPSSRRASQTRSRAVSSPSPPQDTPVRPKPPSKRGRKKTAAISSSHQLEQQAQQTGATPALPSDEEITASAQAINQVRHEHNKERGDTVADSTEPTKKPISQSLPSENTSSPSRSSSRSRRTSKHARQQTPPPRTPADNGTAAPPGPPPASQEQSPTTAAPLQELHSPPAQSRPSSVSPRTRRSFVVRDLVPMPDIPEDCLPTIEHVERMLTTELAVEPGATILVAVSGGVDSVTLLDVLFILSYEHGYALHIAHVNHQLRGEESDADEAFVRTLAKRYDIPCHVTHVDTAAFARKHRLSTEEAARELRYRFLRQMCSTVHAQYCAVAHTADDTAETLLLNLFRGSGLTGLSGIPPKRPLTRKAYLIRPLLGITREEIVHYARARALEWRDDSTNAERSFRRNRVRLDLMPTLKEHFNPRIVETLARTAQLLRQADGFIESLIESTYTQIATARDGRIELGRSQLATLHPFVRNEIIERALTELSGKPVSHAAVERVVSLLSAETGTRQSVVGGIVAIADRQAIVLSDEKLFQTVYLPIFKLGSYSIGRYAIILEEVPRNDVRLGADPFIEYFDYDKLPYRLFLRTWQAGDRFAPIGMHGERVLIADYLTNVKASDYDRRTAVVLATADDIIWLCGYRMSETFKITNDTRRIVRATFRCS